MVGFILYCSTAFYLPKETMDLTWLVSSISAPFILYTVVATLKLLESTPNNANIVLLFPLAEKKVS